MRKANDRMFSIRVVTEGIFYSENAHINNHDYDSGDDRSSLMCFSSEGNTPSIAANIPIGNRALLYVAGCQKFVWAFEYIGTISDGERVARLFGIHGGFTKRWSIFIPIRHLARIDLANAPTLVEIEERTGFHFMPNSFPSKYISEEVYQRIYNAIPWQWTLGDGPWMGAAPVRSKKPASPDCSTTPDSGSEAFVGETNEDVGPQSSRPDLTDPATIKRIYETTYARSLKEDPGRREWQAAGLALLKEVRNASAQELASPEFSMRLWTTANRISSAPDGIDIKRVVANRELAEWIGSTSKSSLPPRGPDRIRALEKIHGELCDRVKPLVEGHKPWARVVRVMAALFPEDFSFVVTVKRLRKVGEAMFGYVSREEEESPVRLNVRILCRLTEILGPTDGTLKMLAVRSQFVWTLWETIGGKADECQPTRPKTDGPPVPNSGTITQPKPPEFVLPPIPNAESLLARIQQVQGKPERNMEDVVKAFLLQLGHAESAVVFQVGHVDVRVNDAQGNGRIVVEVKRTLLIDKVRQDALRKGFDYAGRVGATLVVITDADNYEVYDRNRGMTYDSMLCGRFQLTRFNPAGKTALDLLRPAKPDNIS